MCLNKYKLSIPKAEMQDWHNAVESASGLPREVLSTQTDGLQLLQRVDESIASTERIGWINIWAKVFSALQSVLASVTYQSKPILLLSQRITSELLLQSQTIIDPIRQLKSNESEAALLPEKTERAFRNSIKRLRAYTAWCLWHDKAYFKEFLNFQRIQNVWEKDPSAAENDGDKPSFIAERFLAKSPLDDNLLHSDGKNIMAFYTEKIKRIDSWLTDPALKKWADLISQVSKNNIVGVPFFILFDRTDANISKSLLRKGIRFSYSNYITSSMLSHGSSMEEFINIQDGMVKPLLSGDQEQISIIAPEVISRCQQTFTILGILDGEMQNNPEIRK